MFCRNEFEFPRSKEVKRKSKLMLGTKKVFSLRDGRQIEIETGKLAKQADGSAVVRMGIPRRKN